MINYYLLTKPGIVLGNLVTFAAGFLLASHGVMHGTLFLGTLVGLAFVMGSACVFNNYIDRNLDQKMTRTRHRALAVGTIPERHALIFAAELGLAGALILFLVAHWLAVAVAAVGFFVYVVLYSLWKSRTVYGTAIGSIAGAVPPVVGYVAVSQQLDLGAFLLFAILVLWQMPHFFSIAMAHLEDYTAAKIPVLPVLKGTLRTKIHMVVYIAAFLAVAALLTVYQYTGYSYLAVTLGVGGLWFWHCLYGFSKAVNDQRWGTEMFRLSLVLITAMCVMIVFDAGAA